jgi:N-methylhydantoinase A
MTGKRGQFPGKPQFPERPVVSPTLGVDIGGTFTDFVVADEAGIRIAKVPSTAAEPASGVLAGLDRLGIAEWRRFVHGSTVATNALLERRGAAAAFLATAGFRDLLEIGRQTRLDLYSPAPRKHRPLIPRERCFEVVERMDRHGSVLVPLDEAGLETALDAVVASGASSLAICFLFSFANPDHERRAGERARARGLRVSLSCDIDPEYREYERASTVAADAYVGPVVDAYLGHLWAALQSRRGGGTSPPPQIMQSNGGVIALETARREPVRTVLSGPAGGVIGAWLVAAAARVERVVAFDMGGTSTDVSLVDARPLTSRAAAVDHLPVRVPMLDIHTVGAGGGSLARVDRGGVLRVGPESAGADPGPAAYGRGDQATVTDANLVLGRLYPPAFLGGRMPLDTDRAEAAVAAVGRGLGLNPALAASGILRLVNTQMARAVRRVSLERGHDPRRFCLVAFGGSGPVHACELADEVGARQVLVPRYPGALSALGMVLSDVEKQYACTVMAAGEVGADLLETEFRVLERRAGVELAAEGVAPAEITLDRWLDMRYRGQSYEIAVPAGELATPPAERFHEQHRQAYGYANPDEPTEIVALRVRAVGRQARPSLPCEKGALPVGEAAAPVGEARIWFGSWRDCPRWDRGMLRPGQLLHGPGLLTQEDTTTLLPPGWAGRVDAWYNVLLTPEPAAPPPRRE